MGLLSRGVNRAQIVDRFHRLYYESPEQTWKNTSWLGVPILKNPLDLWIYQEILYEIRPDLIIECGTFRGGSALFLASLCDLLGQGRILTIDIQDFPNRPQHPRITYVLGLTTAAETVERIRAEHQAGDTVMVILDSDHHRDHVLAEMEAYCDLVSPGSYLLIEDGNVNGNPVYPEFGPGPLEAVERFLPGHSEFVVDRSREKFYVTFNPRGYLRRLPASS